jgi:hypothetical protein
VSNEDKKSDKQEPIMLPKGLDEDSDEDDKARLLKKGVSILNPPDIAAGTGGECMIQPSARIKLDPINTNDLKKKKTKKKKKSEAP